MSLDTVAEAKLPEEVKRKYKLSHGGARGYTPFGIETAKGAPIHGLLKGYYHSNHGQGTWFTLTFVASSNGGEIHWSAVAVMLVVGFAGVLLVTHREVPRHLRHLLGLLDVRAEIVASPSQDNIQKLSRMDEDTLLVVLTAGRAHPLILRELDPQPGRDLAR